MLTVERKDVRFSKTSRSSLSWDYGIPGNKEYGIRMRGVNGALGVLEDLLEGGAEERVARRDLGIPRRRRRGSNGRLCDRW